MRKGMPRVPLYLLLGQLLFSRSKLSALGVELPPTAAKGQVIFSSPIANYGDEMNLGELLSSRPIHNEELFEQARQLVESMRATPTCNRAATYRLFTSCGALKGEATDGKDTAEVLERVKSMYAARLAICELTEAGAPIPPHCSFISAISPNSQALGSRDASKSSASSVLEQIDNKELAACLQALASKPQSWTSYSNLRQQASLMCQAYRSEIEREELLEFYRHLTNVGSEVSQALEEAVGGAVAQNDAQMAFIHAVKVLQQEQLEEMTRAHRDGRKSLEETVNYLGIQLDRVATDAQGSLRVMEEQAIDVKQSLQTSEESSMVIARNLEKVFSNAVSGNAELAAEQLRDAEVYRDMAIAIQESLRAINSEEIVNIRKTLGDMFAILNSSRALIAAVSQTAVSLDDGMQDLSIAAQLSLQNMGMLVDSQKTAAALHQQGQGDMAERIRINIAMLDQALSQSANLKADMYYIHDGLGILSSAFKLLLRPLGIVYSLISLVFVFAFFRLRLRIAWPALMIWIIWFRPSLIDLGKSLKDQAEDVHSAFSDLKAFTSTGAQSIQFIYRIHFPAALSFAILVRIAIRTLFRYKTFTTRPKAVMPRLPTRRTYTYYQSHSRHKSSEGRSERAKTTPPRLG